MSGSAGEVTLRNVTAGDLRWMATVSCDPSQTGEHNWAGERDVDAVEAELVADFAATGLAGTDNGTLLVCLPDGTAIGDVSWRTEQWGPTQRSRCPAIGINLLPDHRGRGYGTVAQRLLIDYLFTRDPGLHRVQSDTAVDNEAEQRALAKAGMTVEGRIRHAEYRNGRYHDHLVYGILRSEWTALSASASGPPSPAPW